MPTSTSRPARPDLTPLGLLRRFVSTHRRGYLLGSSLLLATNALGMTIPYLLGRAVSRIEAGAPPDEIARRALVIAGLALATAGVRVGSRLLFLGRSRMVEYELRREVFTSLIHLPRSYHDRQPLGDLMSRLANDVRSVRSFMGPGLLYSVNIVFVLTIGLACTLSIDRSLTLWIVAPFPLLILGIRQTSRSLVTHSRAAQRILAQMTSRVGETVAGIFVVRSYAASDWMRNRFEVENRHYQDRLLAMARSRALMSGILALGTGIGTLVILLIGGRRVIAGELELGDLVAFLAYLGVLVWPTYVMGWVINIWQRSRPALERVCEILDEVPAVSDAADAIELRSPKGRIEFRELTWGYQLEGRPDALREISLTIEPGRTIALVGRVGSGKSTLLSLLARLYPVPDGKIFLDGHDINQIRLADLRRAIVQVPQEAFLFSRAIEENIAYGRPESTFEAVQTAARQSRIDEEIEAFVEGYQTEVGERGVTLSGGQRQRTTLARALIVEPSVLVLDDATSSLDSATEKEILSSVGRLRSERTTILVTHRMSTIRLCDEVLVLVDGRIEAFGDHRAVAERSPTYRKMIDTERLRTEIDGWE